uniref:Uncharacterized protein n=1 Tax=Panagrolaimus davidi TaxID=227884 RepID=A0A914QVP6_9BILA
MNEADAVSDRIIILSNGKVICNGSSNFLKSKFITGFLLTIDFTNAIGPESFQEFAEAVLSVVTKNCKDAKIDGTVHQQFKIFLPHGSQKLFPLIFDDLEFHKDGLQINSFDIGTNTLEQVFIKVTDESEPNKTKDVNESKGKKPRGIQW